MTSSTLLSTFILVVMKSIMLVGINVLKSRNSWLNTISPPILIYRTITEPINWISGRPLTLPSLLFSGLSTMISSITLMILSNGGVQANNWTILNNSLIKLSCLTTTILILMLVRVADTVAVMVACTTGTSWTLSIPELKVLKVKSLEVNHVYGVKWTMIKPNSKDFGVETVLSLKDYGTLMLLLVKPTKLELLLVEWFSCNIVSLLEVFLLLLSQLKFVNTILLFVTIIDLHIKITI